MNAQKPRAQGSGRKAYLVYTVYNNKTDLPVIVEGSATQCAKAMGMKVDSFYCAVTRTRNKQLKKWHITAKRKK